MFLIAMLFSQLAFSANFEGYTEFKAVPLVGEVTAWCDDSFGGGRRAYTHYCNMEILEPFEFGHFTAGKSVADSVVLRSTQSDGSVVEKSLDYNGAEGKSDSVNLWINTLLQTALLNYGQNKIEYQLKSGDKAVNSGSFTATVSPGEQRLCRPAWDHDYMGNCNNSHMVCRWYFERQNWCQ